MLCRSVPFWIWQLLRHVFYLHAARADKQIKMQAQTRTRPAGVMYRVQLTQGWEAWRSELHAVHHTSWGLLPLCLICDPSSPLQFQPPSWHDGLSSSCKALFRQFCVQLFSVIRETAIFGVPELFLIRPTPRPPVPDMFLPWTVLLIHVPCHSARPSAIRLQLSFSSSSAWNEAPISWPEMLEPVFAVLAVVMALFVCWMLMALAKAVKKLAECPFEMATLVKELPMLLLWMDWAFGRTLGSTVSRSCRLRELSF